MRRYLVLIAVMLAFITARSQDSSARPAADTTPHVQARVHHVVPIRRDTLQRDSSFNPADMRKLFHTRQRLVAVDTLALTAHPFFLFTHPVRMPISLHQWEGKEAIFYAIIALLIFFALIRNGFRRYISDLFKIFFQTTVNQRQIKEQLLQSPLPSLLLNLFFLLSIGMFVTLLLQYFGLGSAINFWMLYLYAVAGLLGIYALKFISLKLFGWIFQLAEATDAYIFIVFTTNKVIGMALLPFLVVLAFSYGAITQAAMNLSLLVVCGLFAYRFFLSYVSIHRQVRLSFFHFLLYLVAFEVVPLLVINKLLFSLLGETP